MMRWLLLFLIVVLASGRSLQELACDTSAAGLQSYADALQSLLEQKGWSVVRGKMAFDTDAHGFGNNPSSPYGLYSFGQFERDHFWPMKTNDALVWLGCTPPPVAYYSYRSYVATRYRPIVPGLVFAAMGDSTNLLSFNTSRGASAPSNFLATTAVISTGDAMTYGALTDALRSVGFPANSTNLDIIPPSLVAMTGSILTGDTFGTLVRVALPEPSTESAYQAYLNTSFPALFLHAPSSQQSQPLPLPPQRPRGTGVSERIDMTNLTSNVFKAFQSWGSIPGTNETLIPRAPNGTACIVHDTDCAGNNNDALYFTGRATFPLASKDVIVAWGVNHNATRKAIYANMAVYVGTAGIASINSRHYPGSAQLFDPDGPDASRQFVVMFSRNCALLPEAHRSFCVNLTDHEVPDGHVVKLAGRAYLEIATETGPAADELVAPQVASFSFDKRSSSS